MLEFTQKQIFRTMLRGRCREADVSLSLKEKTSALESVKEFFDKLRFPAQLKELLVYGGGGCCYFDDPLYDHIYFRVDVVDGRNVLAVRKQEEFFFNGVYFRDRDSFLAYLERNSK
jgi:hypothetical protein